MRNKYDEASRSNEPVHVMPKSIPIIFSALQALGSIVNVSLLCDWAFGWGFKQLVRKATGRQKGKCENYDSNLRPTTVIRPGCSKIILD